MALIDDLEVDCTLCAQARIALSVLMRELDCDDLQLWATKHRFEDIPHPLRIMVKSLRVHCQQCGDSLKVLTDVGAQLVEHYLAKKRASEVTSDEKVPF
jgi:hypothetical protein